MTIEHIAILTNNLEVLKDFYVHYFQGTAHTKYINPKKGFESYFIRFESGARLELMRYSSTVDEKSGDPGRLSRGYAHFAFSVSSRRMVDKLVEELRADGYEVVSEPRVTGDGYYEACILDPDGNHVEITE
ncbi:MAG: VOC family protein [Spirochaetales bacterium]|nr:VOC family protein [Spirochaetales bacterium]